MNSFVLYAAKRSRAEASTDNDGIYLEFRRVFGSGEDFGPAFEDLDEVLDGRAVDEAARGEELREEVVKVARCVDGESVESYTTYRVGDE